MASKPQVVSSGSAYTNYKLPCAYIYTPPLFPRLEPSATADCEVKYDVLQYAHSRIRNSSWDGKMPHTLVEQGWQ